MASSPAEEIILRTRGISMLFPGSNIHPYSGIYHLCILCEGNEIQQYFLSS